MIKLRHKFHEHILILGASQTSTVIFNEISQAYLKPDKKIVMLAQKEPDSESIAELQNRFIFYKGNPSLESDLLRVEPWKADAICINLFGQPDGDMQTFAILSVLKPLLDSKNAQPLLIAIIAKEQYKQKLINYGFNEESLVCVETLFPYIAAQVCRQKNLKAVFNEILSVKGNDIYQYPSTEFIGSTWSKVLRAFENACPIGIKQNGSFVFNPDQNTLITEETELLILASDLKKISMAPAFLPAPDYNEIVSGKLESDREESFLILGWGTEGTPLISKLKELSEAPKTVLIVSEKDPLVSDFSKSNLSIAWQNANQHKSDILETIKFEYFENIIICAEGGPDSSAEIELLQRVKEILARTGLTNNITILLGALTQETKSIQEGLSTDIIIKLATQILLHPPLLHLSRELIQPKKAKIYLNPVENYVEIDSEVNFYTLIEAARKKNETAIGYITQLETGTKVTLNPMKDQKQKFYHFDRIIVFSNKNVK